MPAAMRKGMARGKWPVWPVRRAVCIFFAVAAAWGGSELSGGAPPPAVRETAADKMRREVMALLSEGRVAAALNAAQAALARNKGDGAVRDEFVSLHVSLGRRLISEEEFPAAERALEAALRVDENAHAARALLRKIHGGRAAAPGRVDAARAWLELEWFEPAFVTLRQATALVPDRRQAWLGDYLAAAIGAGDDEYCTKNFHEAFYYYDAALKLGDESGVRPTASLVERWLQSLSHAMSRDVDRAAYPPAFWKLAIERSESLIRSDNHSALLKAALRGFAYENMGDAERAAKAYRLCLGILDEAGGDVRALRESVIGKLRQRYDVNLCCRRDGFWGQAASGDWQIMERGPFRVHHRNEAAGRRVASAAVFQFGRIAKYLGLDADEVKWSVPCDVYLHGSAAAFREATGLGDATRAASIIHARKRNLERHEIHVYQSDPMLLSASLSHEIAHLIAASATEYRPMMGAISEGLALQMEPKCRHRQFARLFRENKHPRGLGALLGVSEAHPSEAAFYAEAFQLTAVLGNEGGYSRFLEAAGGRKTPSELARLFGFESTDALDKAYFSAPVGVRVNP
ncbi:MAG: hypothetical protein IPK83_13425 [Planctomycetes bacterium]|nr:hypothetical protein [Planctomycetota bacterium]